jgi:hypothetical protein
MNGRGRGREDGRQGQKESMAKGDVRKRRRRNETKRNAQIMQSSFGYSHKKSKAMD